MTDVQEFVKLARGFAMVRKNKRSTRSERAEGVYRGWRCLGHGYFGEAWEHVDHYGLVMKISGPTAWGRGDSNGIANRAQNHGLKADAWPAFAAFCKDHPHPRLPRIHHLEHISASFTFGVLDRLVPVESVEMTSAAYDNIYNEMCEIERVLNGGPAQDYPWLWPLVKMRDALNFYVDLHEENVMWDHRLDSWVITDPFSCSFDDDEDVPSYVESGAYTGTGTMADRDAGTSRRLREKLPALVLPLRKFDPGWPIAKLPPVFMGPNPFKP